MTELVVFRPISRALTAGALIVISVTATAGSGAYPEAPRNGQIHQTAAGP